MKDLKSIILTDAEAALLDRGRREPPFHPKGDKQQRAVCALVDRGLMTINGPIHTDNRCFTTFPGAYALAGWAGKRSAVLR